MLATPFDMDQVAQRLGMKRRSLTTLIASHPYYFWAGKKKVFTEAHIALLIEAVEEKTKCRNTSTSAKAQTVGGLTLRSRAVAGYAEVLELLSESSRKTSRRQSKPKNGTGLSKVIPLHSHSQRP